MRDIIVAAGKKSLYSTLQRENGYSNIANVIPVAASVLHMCTQSIMITTKNKPYNMHISKWETDDCHK